MRDIFRPKETSSAIHSRSPLKDGRRVLYVSRSVIFSIFLSAASLFSYSQGTLTIGSTTVVIDTIRTGMDVPWEIVYGPDNHLWVTERRGVVCRIDPIAKTRQDILDITSTVYAEHEAGLLGMALHPGFTVTPEVFLVYTYSTQPNVRERLVKYTWNGTSLVNPVILIDGILGNTAHNGSRLLFLPDGTMLMTTGDANAPGAVPQNTAHLNGKVLRLHTNGAVPSDNPFPGYYTYTFGHRNAQGLGFGPGGKIYLSEHGPTTDDEFQEVVKGRNYGWPSVTGFCDDPSETAFCAANNVKEPLFDWTPTIAPAGLIYYENNSFPEFDQSFLMTTLRTKKLVSLRLNASGTASVSESSYLQDMFGRLRAVCTGPLKEIYLATNGAQPFNIDPFTHSILVMYTPTPTVSLYPERNAPWVRIYPSITENTLCAEASDDANEDISLSIMNVSGQKCFDFERLRSSERIDVTGLSPGIYFVTLFRQGAPVFRTRFVKY
jgi:aldose sugar dehydrogenase